MCWRCSAPLGGTAVRLARIGGKRVGLGKQTTVFYLLLIIPHLVALAALLGYALRSRPRAVSGDDWESSGSEGEPKPPPQPRPLGPAIDGPPLPDGAAPPGRLRDADRLPHPRRRRRRREHPAHPPEPTPRTTAGAEDSKTPEFGTGSRWTRTGR